MRDGSRRSGGLLIVNGLNADRVAEAKFVNIKKDDMGGGDNPGKPHRIVTIALYKSMDLWKRICISSLCSCDKLSFGFFYLQLPPSASNIFFHFSNNQGATFFFFFFFFFLFLSFPSFSLQ
jgi:hypothetical protein